MPKDPQTPEEARRQAGEILLERSRHQDIARRLGRHASEYLGAVLENLGAGALLIDGDDRRLVLANQELADLVGITVPALLQLTRGELIEHIAQLGEDVNAVRDLLARIPQRGPYAADGRFILVRPRRRVIHWTARPVALPDGAGQLCIYRDVTREADHAAELERVAETDALTGLGNRRRALAALMREMAITERRGGSLCVALYDIDHFKRVNDTAGHAAGDALLRDVGSALRECSRQSDIVARWGGEEFLAVLPDCTLDGACAVAERFRERLHLLGSVGGVGAVTVSGGIARCRPGESVDDLVRRADRLLYLAKANGRDRIESEADPRGTF